MSSDVPMIVTQFRDFELEERVIRILAYRGFRIGERKINGRRELHPGEILITDEGWTSDSIPLISLPMDARSWQAKDLERFLQDQILPPLHHVGPGGGLHQLLLIGGEGRSDVRAELLQSLHRIGCVAIFTPFDESDLRTALIPTRRREERERFDRFVQARFALFLIDLERDYEYRIEIAKAQSLIEYRRRVHPHLNLGFALIGGRKAKRREVAALFDPFPNFWVDQPREEMLRLWPMRKSHQGGKFRKIEEWIGSSHGDSREPSALPHRALTRGGRASR